jgi:transcriptional regulator with XRE-family HTH domain
MTVITDDEAKQNIANNIRILLAERNWKQSDLASATGESEMRVSLAVRGRKLPSAAFLARIAEALNSTVDRLLSPMSNRDRQVG